MNGFAHSIYVVLGCAAVLTGTSACSSRPTPEPSSPTLGTSPGRSTIEEQTPTSTGGSNTMQPGFDTGREQDREQPSTGQPGTTPEGEAPSAGQPGTPATPMGAGPATGMEQPEAQGPQPASPGTTAGTKEAPASINEREACALLMSEAIVHMEPVDGGVSIVAKPRRGVDVAKLRSRMEGIQRGIEHGGPVFAAEQCELFALGRSGAVALIETPDSLRLLVTTNDASRVQHLRRQARDFIQSSGAPTPRAGSSKGGTPQPKGEAPPAKKP